ncbi:MAG TPA: serine/threonine-protein kinase, partial [Kofleriaceae bacterium]|nr:serine/threonine-protein kinase [Kofleriaceae bacterium]
MPFLDEGDLLGRYRVEAFLAEGGMGRVYRAVDTVLGRRVALKVLAAPAQQGTPAIARLLREARAAAALSHPNICAVFDVGEADGQPFIAMELVQGTSLRVVLPDPAVGLDQRLRWVHELASALAAAHRLHIVHRDIKPDNVMIASDGRVRLLDFGVAKWEGEGDELAVVTPDSVETYRTREGEIVGTSGYMAPEQAVGGQVDARTDQFAWGVVAYELLAGGMPWKSRDAMGLAAEIVGTTPRAIARVPDAIDRVIARAMAKDRDERFPSMRALVAELDEAKIARKGSWAGVVVAALVVIGGATLTMLAKPTDGGSPSRSS